MVLSLQLPLLFREGVTWCSGVQNSARYSGLPQQPESCPAKAPCLEDAYQAWVYSENDFKGCSLSGRVTSRWPFCRTGGPLSWFFFQRGKTHFQTWVLNSVPGFLQHEGAVASWFAWCDIWSSSNSSLWSGSIFTESLPTSTATWSARSEAGLPTGKCSVGL